MEWDYRADLFESETIGRWIGHFRTLLTGMVEDAACPIAALPVLAPRERVQILKRWNDTRLEPPPITSVPELFTLQVERTPDRVAVEGGGHTLTYRELGRRVDQLAYHLRGLGVGPEVVVGLCVERSVDLVVGLLGILQAGGAYLPLDPAHPSERLGFMLAEVEPPVLVTQTPLLHRFPVHGAKVVCLDRQQEEMPSSPRAEGTSGVTLDTLAYLIYTSGSTGQPKGTEIPHRAVINLLTGMQRILQLTERDAWLAVTTLSFDIAVLEILLPLSVGARVVVMESDGIMDAARLAERLTADGITIMQATPTTWRLLLENGWKGHPGLTILCGGEALPRALAAALLERADRVWNVYGPTETTVWSTAFRVTPAEGPVPIGRPIANTQVYVLDPRGQPVPIGVPGELHIGGLGVARGYFKRPELTQERFVLRALDEGPDARVYRTGDQVRFRADGNLEFLGRLDDQVKVRGYRVEPGEIEVTLSQHPAVRAAAVVARETTSEERLLVGYLVLANGPAPSFRELQQFLRAKLPPSMVPSAFVFLDALPLTPNGKVDRRALPLPDRARSEEDTKDLAPRTPTEDMIARIWTDVLGVARIGVHDNFFDLGGHSLRAMQIISRMRRVLEVEIPLRRVFETPTVAGLAEYADLARWSLRDGTRDRRRPRELRRSARGARAVTAVELLARLRALDVRVWAEGTRLRASAPKGVLTAELQASLDARKAEILGLLASFEARPHAAAPPLEQCPRTEPLPLSFSQERLWFLDQLDPHNPAYVLTASERLHGPLDVAALQRSLDEVVRRHETLRTCFPQVAGRPVQRIVPPEPVRLEHIDLGTLPEGDRAAAARRIVTDAAAQSFDLTRGPLMRATVVRIDPEEHLLLLTMHHIITDQWSLGVLSAELTALYRAFSAGQPSPLPDPPVQYADFACWQRAWLAGPVLDRQLAYWRDRLTPLPAMLELPTDRPRPASAVVPRGPTRLRALRLAQRAPSHAEPRGGRDAVHDIARRVQAPARTPYRSGGCRRRDADCEPHARGARRHHRFYRQQPGPADKSGRTPHVPRGAGASA